MVTFTVVTDIFKGQSLARTSLHKVLQSVFHTCLQLLFSSDLCDCYCSWRTSESFYNAPPMLTAILTAIRQQKRQET